MSRHPYGVRTAYAFAALALAGLGTATVFAFAADNAPATSITVPETRGAVPAVPEPVAVAPAPTQVPAVVTPAPVAKPAVAPQAPAKVVPKPAAKAAPKTAPRVAKQQSPPAYTEQELSGGYTVWCSNGYLHADGSCSSRPDGQPAPQPPNPDNPCSGTASQCLDATGGLRNPISGLFGGGR
jgi:outer membrane biosynthesis protein TonB